MNGTFSANEKTNLSPTLISSNGWSASAGVDVDVAHSPAGSEGNRQEDQVYRIWIVSILNYPVGCLGRNQQVASDLASGSGSPQELWFPPSFPT